MAKSLIAYFSLTGNTKKTAQMLATVTGGDLLELKPVIPYTSPVNPVMKEVYAKSKDEASDPACRPELSDLPESIDSFDTLYVGFPMWWNAAPKLIHTFLEAYHLEGKTVIPFATAGGKAWGDTNEKLSVSTTGARLLTGCVLSKDSTEESLGEWVHSLGL